MFNVVVEIKAPEIVEAIRSLVGALIGARPADITSVQIPSILPTIPQTQEQTLQTPPELYQTQQPAQQQYAQPQQQVQQQQIQPQQAPLSAVPTTAQTYSLEQLAVAATQLVDAGRRTELVTLLGSFGVQALTALPKEQYGNFATQLRSMGAKI